MREVSRFLKALADEARLEILWLLLNHRELCVCDLMAALGTTQSKVSRHLATLRHAGLVANRRQGTWAYYSIQRPADGLERAVLDALRAGLAKHPGAARILSDFAAHGKCTDVASACNTRGAQQTKAASRAAMRPRSPRPGGRR